MKELLKQMNDERPVMIITGIIAFYLLITGFIVYLYFIHRLEFITDIVLLFVVTVIYIPRFLIIGKLQNKDKISIRGDFIEINTNMIKFSDIVDFRCEKRKPEVIFFINNRMIVYNEALFHIKLTDRQISFIVIGSEKISLLKKFMCEVIEQ